MKQLMSEINDKLEYVLNNAAKRNSFNRDHIFYETIKLIKEKVSFSQRLRILHVFAEIEKTLALLKGMDEDYAYQAKKLDTLYLTLEDDLKFYLSLSYFPMKALQYFEKFDFETAISSLDDFFNHSGLILDSDPVLMNLACGEQYLNLFRVYLSAKNEENTVKVARNLMMLCHYNQLYYDDLPIIATKGKFVDILSMDPSEYLFWKIYNTDNIFKKFRTTSSRHILIKIVEEIVACFEENETGFFFYSIKCLDAFYRNSMRESVVYFFESLEYFNERSNILLEMNVNNVNSIFESLRIDNPDFKKLANRIITNDFLGNKIVPN